MIVRMSYFNLLALKSDKKQIMERLQRFEDVHFKNLPEGEDGFLTRLSEEDAAQMNRRRDEIRGLIAEIEQHERKNRKLVSRKLRRQSLIRSMNVSSMTFEELKRRADEIDISGLLSTLDKAETQPARDRKTKVLYQIVPWETQKLSDDELVEIRDGRAVLGTVSQEAADALAEELRRMGKAYAIVSKEKDGSILFVIKATEEQKDHVDILVAKFRMKRRSVQGTRMNWEIMNFRRTIDQMIGRSNRTDGSLERMADHKESLQIYLEYLNNLLLRNEESKKFLESESSILIAGFIPTEREEEFRAAAKEGCESGVYMLKLEDAASQGNEVPVKLKNNKMVSAFESLTHMYSVPRYNEIDPTPLFTPFYMLFFGMMLADIGYGLIMMLASGLVLKLFDLKKSMADMIRFLFYLSFAVIAWGAVYGSFFCGLIEMPSLINPNTEYTRVLILSMVMGFFHLMIALGIKAAMYIRDGHPFLAIFDVGFWYMSLGGLVLVLVKGFVPAFAHLNSTVLWIVAIVGMAGIIFTNGRSARTILGRGAEGLYSLYGLTNYLGDVVSYSRLMALGLAGGSIGLAINMIIKMIQSSGIIGIIISIPVFIGIHMFNLLINGLSAYVHSSRLIYVEFFGKFYEGGGVAFKPFRAEKT